MYLKFSLLSIFLLTSTVHAADGLGIFLEPAITYETGEASVNYPSPLSNSTGQADGLGLGARLGFHLYEAFFLGFDGRYSMPDYTDSSVSYDSKSVSTNWGLVAGMQMPIVGLRIWGSYIIGGELNPENSGSFNIKFANAQGYRVGAGFRLTVVSLNLEFQQLKYDQVTLEELGPFSSDSALDGVDLENKSWIASISFPLEF